MIPFLSNILTALSTQNENLVNILLVPASIIENYLLMNLFLIIHNSKASYKEKIIYIFCMTIVSLTNLSFVSTPVNVLLNYVCMFLLIKFIFKFGWLKSFVSLIIPIFVFGLLNVLIQNPYLTLCKIDTSIFLNTPLYRLIYLLIVYSIMELICIITKKILYSRHKFNFLDNLDKHTSILLLINLFVGFFTLCIQLLTTTFYLQIVPIIISILNFILLVTFLILSIYSFTHMIKLALTKQELQSAEEYNKSLEILYDEVKGFKHDFNNIVSTLDGFIETDDIDGLKEYFCEIKKECNTTNNLSVLNPRIINNPGIYSLLNNKYFKALNLGVTFDIEYFLDLNTLKINLYQFSRILGILIDNALEEAEKCNEKIIRVSFIKEHRNKRAVITIENTYSNKDVDLEKIFVKGESGKKNHSGIGLWEVKNYVTRSKNLDLFTSKDSKFFKQELSIYDS